MVAVRYVLLSGLAAFGLAPAAAAEIAGPVAAEVERVVDGDTVRVSAEIWVDQRLSVSVRLRGVDAPELYRPQCEAERAMARRAKAFVEERIGDSVRLSEIEHDKYGGRVVARIETASGDLGEALVGAGLAVPAGTRDPWCE